MTEDFTWDQSRKDRIGFDEAIFCQGKSASQINNILNIAGEADHPLLLTRLDAEKLQDLSQSHQKNINFDPVSKTAFFGKATENPATKSVCVLAAGSSDVPVAREACRTLDYLGLGYHPFFDIGVAGLWRLTDKIGEISSFRIVIVVAGMDAALASVVGGLVSGLIIAVPTSVGYGVATGGQSALNSMLASCAPGIVVCNIDNGYGAACAAKRALGQMG